MATVGIKGLNNKITTVILVQQIQTGMVTFNTPEIYYLRALSSTD